MPRAVEHPHSPSEVSAAALTQGVVGWGQGGIRLLLAGAGPAWALGRKWWCWEGGLQEGLQPVQNLL